MSPPSTEKSGSPKRPRKRRVLRLFILIALTLILIAILYGGFKYRQWSARPSYWQQNTQMLGDIPIAEKRQRAESFMGDFAVEWNAFGEGAIDPRTDRIADAAQLVLGNTRTIIIPFEDLNILLEVEMPAILESQGTPLPSTVKGIMVTSDGHGRLIVAFEYDGPEVHQVFSMTLDVTVNDRGVMTSTLVSAQGGELTLPHGAAMDRLGEIIGGERAWGDIKLMKLFTGQPFGPMDVPIDRGDGGIRSGRITGIEIHDDAIHLTRTTVPRHRPGTPRPRIEIDE